MKCSPISAIDNDRICGVRVLLPASKDPQCYLTILGLYMPSAELPQETFSLYLESVEHLISQLNSDGPLLVLGDFNALLGSRDSEDPHSCNNRGNQWNTLIEDHTLYNVSLGCVSTGPTHTFASGGNMTTIDYVLANQDALREISSCVTAEDHPLNTSDHLSIKCCLDLSHLRCPTILAFPKQPLNRVQGEKSLSTSKYAKETDNVAHPLLGKDYTSIEEIEGDLQHVCQKLVEAADLLIPRKKTTRTPVNRVKDNIYAGKVGVFSGTGRMLEDHVQVL